MALYKYQQYLEHTNHEAFDKLYHPATITPHSGIYRCEVCGHEVTSVAGYQLPPQNHHQHPQGQKITWRLVVSHA
jgi:hypothetical protein